MRLLTRTLAAVHGCLLAAAAVVTSGAQTTPAPSCTGLCLQQTTSCPAGQTTSISGVVYAPNGKDPLPNVTVYVPNAAVDAFAAGVSCPIVGAPPSGSPLVGAYTAVDGSFSIPNMPVGTAIPLVIVTGRWRVQTTVNTTACTNTVVPAAQTHLPQDQTQGDIPRFAVLTGALDQVECVLRKVGVADSEFTGPTGTGRINLFLPTPGNSGPGAMASTLSGGSGGSGTQASLTGSTTPALMNYDVLMLPCQGGPYIETAVDLASLQGFVNSGGRVYSSHYSYEWLYGNSGNGPFASVANWQPGGATLNSGTATVNTAFADGALLSQWLELVGASPTVAPSAAQITLNQIKHDLSGVVAPTSTYLTLNQSLAGRGATDPAPVEQLVFNTPLGATNQCGKVLFNDYHVETALSGTGVFFPAECTATATMTPQEKLLEYSLFELTNDGAAATLTPTTADFGTDAIGFNTAAQTFTLTNNSTFPTRVSVVLATGDFAIASNNCTLVSAGASCQIGVVFNPTAVGARTGTLTVGSNGSTLNSTLTGSGIPDLNLNLTALDFGSADVGATVTRSITVTNNASGNVPIPTFTSSSTDFSVGTTCGSSVAAFSTCQILVAFKPTVYGPRTGNLAVANGSAAYTGATTSLTGNGLDFSVSAAPVSGTVIAGYNQSLKLTTTPLGGFSAPVSISCTTNAPASTCTPQVGNLQTTTPETIGVTITTTSRYAVVGYGGVGGDHLFLWTLVVGSGGLLFWRRRQTGGALRNGLLLLLVAATSLSLGGCSGKQPAMNSSYTPATTGSGSGGSGSGGSVGNGGYTYTLTVSDGFLVHSATYMLAVTVR